MTESGDLLAATLAEERAASDELAPHYRRWTLSGSLLYDLERAAFADLVLDTLRAAGTDPSAARFLDIGCGTGEILEQLANRGCRHLTGFDLSPAMLGEARRHVPAATLALGTVERHPFRPRSFEVVTASFALHHLHEPATLFAVARELVSPTGWLFVLDYNRDGWWRSPRWRRLTFRFGVAPFRFLLRAKNRRAIAAQPPVRSRFNPSHRLHLPAELEASARTHGFSARATTHGLLRLWLLNDVFAESRFDRALLRHLATIEDAVTPAGAGGLLWLTCRVDRSAQTR